MSNKITIEQARYTYVFQVYAVMREEDMKKLREKIRQQLEEGCVLLPTYVNLVSVEKRLETFAGI